MSSAHRWWPVGHGAIFGVGAVVLAAMLFLIPHRAISPVPKPVAPVRVVAVKPKPVAKPVLIKKAAPQKSVFATEQMMSPSQLMKRWDADVSEAAKRFGVPIAWINAVMRAESGGRTMLAEGLPMTSSQGAMGLMQLMPETYEDMRRAYRLGNDPYDPHDNILAGTAYLRFLRGKYGYPQMFAAYNDGPGNLEQRLRDGGLLPEETRNYLGNITNRLEGGSGNGLQVKFTKPDGSPVMVDIGAVTAVRAALPDEYAASVKTVIKVGRIKQGVREDVTKVKAAIRGRGGAI